MKIIIKNIKRNLKTKPYDIIKMIDEDAWYNIYDYENGEYLCHSELVNDINDYILIPVGDNKESEEE